MVRMPCYDENGMKKGAWSEEEDNKLRDYIQRYGHWNWRQLPKFAGLKRCGRSCRLRWLNYLRPDLKRGNFTNEEEDLIIELHEKLGSKWSVIATKLSGRTDNEIKNYWHTHLKKRVGRNTTSPTCVKEESSSTSECEAKRTEEEMLESVDTHLDTAVSTQQSSYGALSFELSDYGIWASMDLAMEDSAGSPEMLTESFGSDFWTQPFIEDNFYMHNSGFGSQALLGGREFTSPYSAHYDDDVDVFGRWMP